MLDNYQRFLFGKTTFGQILKKNQKIQNDPMTQWLTPHPTLSKGEGFKVLLLWRRMSEGCAV